MIDAPGFVGVYIIKQTGLSVRLATDGDDMAPRLLTDDDVRALLRRACDEAGGMSAVAREIGCTPQFVSSVLKGERGPSGPILERLGLADAGRRYVRK